MLDEFRDGVAVALEILQDLGQFKNIWNGRIEMGQD
jgi:hypothetical protein